MVPLKQNKGSTLSLVLLGFICFLFVVGLTVYPVVSVRAQGDETGTMAPINPAFLGQMEQLKMGLLEQQAAGGERALGYRPSPLDLSHLRGQKSLHSILGDSRLLALDPVYDLRIQGKLTSIRDQGGCGSCWSFASYGSLESNLLPSESTNFSENNLKNTHGFDWGYCDGGNGYISTAYLARWSGPVNESDDPYDPGSSYSPPGLGPRKHMQEVFIIPDRASSADNSDLKQAVVDHGAIYTTMYWDASFYSSTNKSYHYDGRNPGTCYYDTENSRCYSNHAVAIVGWDDDFDKNKFSPPASANGAFIIRNSWGTSWGEAGYFYISYYDSNVGSENFVFNGVETTFNYSKIYQYDPLGWVTSLGYGNTTGWFANIFTATENEQVAAVSFYTAALDSSYQLYVYRNVASGPTAGSLAGSKSGTIGFPGFHTVILDLPVAVTPGEKFSVVVRLTTPGYNYPIPIEYPDPGYSSDATANPGESYVSGNGTSWSDISLQYSGTNVCLKAFAVIGESPETVVTPATLSGPEAGDTEASYTYMTGGSSSTYGHDVQYFFDWGDGTDSGWLSVGTTNASKSWDLPGTYTVRSKARCASDISIESNWSDPLSVTVSDVSYAFVTLLTPNGGGVVLSGSTYRVQWGAPAEATSFKVSYSMDNGTTWKVIAPNVLEYQYDWIVPTPTANKKKCLVKVVGYNGSRKVGSDKSYKPFTIEVVRLTSPNGGSTLTPGDYVDIQWVTNETKRPVSKVKLYYSKTNGTTWSWIDTPTENLGTYLWKVPKANSYVCKVKLVLLDESGVTLGNDISDTAFRIKP